MATYRLRIIQEDEVYINVHTNLDQRGRAGYETDIELYNKDGQGWVAVMKFDDMPPQESFEAAIDRLGLYLKKMSVAVKSKNMKHMNPEPLFRPTYK